MLVFLLNILTMEMASPWSVLPQVVVSKDVFDAIDATKLGYQYMSKPLGAEQLRGLPKEIELIQVAPARFANRIFPPLRLDKAAPAEEDDDIESQHSGSTVAVGNYPGALEKEVFCAQNTLHCALHATAQWNTAKHRAQHTRLGGSSSWD